MRSAALVAGRDLVQQNLFQLSCASLAQPRLLYMIGAGYWQPNPFQMVGVALAQPCFFQLVGEGAAQPNLLHMVGAKLLQSSDQALCIRASPKLLAWVWHISVSAKWCGCGAAAPTMQRVAQTLVADKDTANDSAANDKPRQ